MDRRRHPAGRTLLAGLIGLLLASLLNAHSLTDVARRQERGPLRSVALTLSTSVAKVSSTLRLDAPRAALDDLLGRGDVPAVAAPPSPAASPLPRATDATGWSADPADPATAWIVGDSLVELFGPRLADELAEDGLVEPEVDFRFITGLSRPDVFDWTAHLRERMQNDPPRLVVLMFGGNDGQPVNVDGVTYVEYTPEWWELYRRRVAEAMDAVRGSLAYWVGLPIMKDPAFREHARRFNEVYAGEADERAWVRYVSSWELFADAQGRYADYLPNLNGDMRLMRYQDGVHFTPSGALRLALHVEEAIADDRRRG